MNSGELGAPAFAWITVIGLVSGAASFLVFRHWTDGDRLRRCANRIVAHLLEIRLFSDEPRLVLRAQRDLILENGRVLRQVIAPLLILPVPFGILLSAMDLFFGHAPLHPGESALVTVQFKSAPPATKLEAPPGIDLDDQSVYITTENQVVWQVRAKKVMNGELNVTASPETLSKGIAAGNGFSFAPEERASSLWQFFLHPGELPFSSNFVASIKIGYRPATVFRTHWLWWFGLSSLVGAGLLALIR